MASTMSPSVRWVVGDTVGLNEVNATAAIPAAAAGAVFQATGTTVPTATPSSGRVIHITSTDAVYFWNSTAWVGPYTQAT